MKVDNRKDIILLLLYIAGYSGKTNEPVEGFTRLQKLLFLLDKEYKIGKLVPNYFHFVAFDYGPFDETIFSDIEALVNYGLVDKNEEDKPKQEDSIERQFLSDYFYEKEDGDGRESQEQEHMEVFKLTPKGETVAQQLYSSLNPNVKDCFIKLKKRFNQRSLTSLIQYVYTNFPEYTKYSKLRY